MIGRCRVRQCLATRSSSAVLVHPRRRVSIHKRRLRHRITSAFGVSGSRSALRRYSVADTRAPIRSLLALRPPLPSGNALCISAPHASKPSWAASKLYLFGVLRMRSRGTSPHPLVPTRCLKVLSCALGQQQSLFSLLARSHHHHRHQRRRSCSTNHATVCEGAVTTPNQPLSPMLCSQD